MNDNNCNMCNLPANFWHNAPNYKNHELITTNLLKMSVGNSNPDFHFNIDLLCNIYIINNNKYIKKCCYEHIVQFIRNYRSMDEIFITFTLDFSNYVRIKEFKEYKFNDDLFSHNVHRHALKITYSGIHINLSSNIIKENIIKMNSLEKNVYCIKI